MACRSNLALIAARDPLMAARLRAPDPQRVIRALAVLNETGRSLASFQDAAQRREAAVNGAFKRSGVEAMSLSTDEDLVRAIVRMASLRRRRRR